ncbi:AGE family epimerase/isomerase [Actinoplanes aureus]|uniref:AGE family epimerase/isomerase n=1 Tax=Actinoplanes aureus TaxID=2792083 RepID=UPI001E555581|nr:AGE family epimerase/isomerase [Actinoplanes aureus]
MNTSWLGDESGRLLDFGRGFAHPLGGAAWLRADGTPDLGAPVYTWITARMAHVYSLGHLLGVPGAGPLADAALAGLTGILHDRDNGGWYPSVAPDGRPEAGKSCYDHAFVVLAAFDVTGRPDCLHRALAITERTVGWGRRYGWRLPEHFDAQWNPRPDYHRERPQDPFKPCRPC